VGKKPAITNWDHFYDNQPDSNVPRISFNRNFSTKYLEKKRLILEVGCGTGSFTKLIDRQGCFGLDLNFNAIKIAKQHCTCSEFIVASAVNLPFKDEVFDFICVWQVFEELPIGDEIRAMDEIQRTLTRDASFLLSACNDHLFANIFDPPFIFSGYRHYNLKKLLELISKSKLIVSEYTIRGGLNTLVSNFLFFFYKHILNKKEGQIKNFFERKSADEFNSSMHGIVYIYIRANKEAKI